MPSAPAGGSRASQRRRAASASPARGRRNIRSGSAPPSLAASLNPLYRRALSASPGIRQWRPPRPRRASASPRRSTGASHRRSTGPSRTAKALTSALALQGALMGRMASTPYVGTSGKALAVYPLGSSGPLPYYLASKTYNVGALTKYPVVERVRGKRRPSMGGRKTFPGGQPPSEWYEPKNVWVGGKPRGSRRAGAGRTNTLPKPVISATNVLRLESMGFQLPKEVLKQAHAGKPIISTYKISKNMQGALARRNPRLFPALMDIHGPVPNRFGPEQLGLPQPVQKKLRALENRTRAAAVHGTARAIAAPYRMAAKARNLTGRAAASVGRGAASVARGARYAASVPGEARRKLMRILKAQERRLPN